MSIKTLFNVLNSGSVSIIFSHVVSNDMSFDVMSKVTDWLIVNMLSLNITKTKYTVFYTKQKRIQPPKIKVEYVVVVVGLILKGNCKLEQP